VSSPPFFKVYDTGKGGRNGWYFSECGKNNESKRESSRRRGQAEDRLLIFNTFFKNLKKKRMDQRK
jgi:hypothetical protein